MSMLTSRAFDELLAEQRQPFQRLVARHPDMLPAVMQYTSHVPPGWESLVDHLLTRIAALPEGEQRVSIQKISEQCAGLSVYCYVNGRHSLQSTTRNHMNVEIADSTTERTNLLLDVQGLLESARVVSRMTCQACGAAGAMRIQHGYLTVTCVRHTSWRSAFRERRLDQSRQINNDLQ